MELCECELLIVCHHPAMFGGHRYSGTRYIMFFSFSPEGHVTMWIGVKLPRLVTNLSSLVTIGTGGSENVIVLVCHVILQDHLTRALSNFMGGTWLI